MQPQQTPTKPVMDIAPPPKPATPPPAPAAAPTPAPATLPKPEAPAPAVAAGIPTKTGGAMPVKEAPGYAENEEPQDAADQAVDIPAPEAKLQKPKPAGQSVTGIVVATVAVMVMLASLAIVVYLKS